VEVVVFDMSYRIGLQIPTPLDSPDPILPQVFREACPSIPERTVLEAFDEVDVDGKGRVGRLDT
jgi:hypothetical protein